MGKVFTWSEVAAKQVPTLESFTVVLESVKEEISANPAFPASLVCGSVIRGDHNIRSDIDCLVFYDANQQAQAFEAMQNLTALAHTHYVPLTFIPADTVVAKTDMHHCGPAFVRHLEVSARQGGRIKHDPLSMIADSTSFEEENKWYLRLKMYNLQESLAEYPTFSEERKASCLKKMLEAPVHVARRVLQNKKQLMGDSKHEVIDQYARHMPEHLGELLHILVAVDRDYTQELEEQLRSPHKKGYQRFIRDLERHTIYEVLNFVRGNLLEVATAAR